MDLAVAGGVFAAAFAAAAASWIYLPVYLRKRAPEDSAPDAAPQAAGGRLRLTWSQWAFCLLAAALLACLMTMALDAGTGLTVLLRLSAAGLYLLSAAVFDSRSRLIPNFLTVIALVCGLLLTAVSFVLSRSAAVAELINCLIGAICCFCVFYLLSRLTREGLGMGDVKLISALAWLIGLEYTLFTVLFGMLICAAAAAVLLLGKKKNKTDHVPFGPFVFFGYIALLFLRF